MTAAAPLPSPPQPAPRPLDIALLASVFVVAACGLLYELVAGALASYVLGDSVLQFSTIIGTYLFAMGVGSWLSRYFDRQLPAHFLRIELLVAVVGGALPALLFLANAYVPGAFRLLLYGMVLLVGMLVGLEIPLVMRILKRNVALKDLVSQVLTFDYLGALAVSLAFPLLLVPHLGLVRTGLLFGIFNAVVAVWALWLFRHELRRFRAHALACAAVLGALLAGFAGAEHITRLAEDHFYQDRIVIASASPYQRIVVTHGRSGYRLFLNGNLQFAERDEYRYHEALVHPAMSAHGAPKRVAVLGGGDGMAVREILKYPSVESVTLVELDPAMTRLFRTDPALVRLNAGALNDPRVHIVNTDAFQWLQEGSGGDASTSSAAGPPQGARAPSGGSEPRAAGSVGAHDTFDVIVVDFPDPTNFAIGKLYTNSFYALLEQRLSASGYAVVQTTSPLVARQSFWTVVQTVESVGLATAPYHVHVPSFGEWGFVIASRRPWRLPEHLPGGLRFLSVPTLPLLFDFPLDMARVPAEVNRLSNQVLVHTYEQEWGKVAAH
ncbi:spermidine synthase [Paracidovorax avenae]|uniref:polyamine aminopropyltransferase n=1 Tax=Paracidovorax avenae TaxID=80867 RepID=UPI000D152B42|nr:MULTISPECIES: polyamine aminopropyltransferase [Comamonadaceae]AVS63847.1 spermidine synthase [Paracidovorax avenae]AVT14411.1 spermidine synthase [Paracidovorax avenae]MDA8450340.1 polyamine aminopropyltransferase [Acidovorax sp. GBBC 3297]MDA8459785.1 polyamine aminopropyltransferase [Acidovorax sp. GBBC 3333]MDA8464821.1 polyamine aminopropyltransferase [Acidovorax sp. GBBC 3332]